MENQHKHIQGYRDLSKAEIDAMNTVKDFEASVGKMIQHMEQSQEIDQESLAHAKQSLRVGFMLMVRSIAKPQGI